MSFWLRAEFAVGLHVNTVRAVIKIEIVHIDRPHVNLQSVSDLAEGHLQALGLFAVDAHQVLRVVRREAGEKSNDILADIPSAAILFAVCAMLCSELRPRSSSSNWNPELPSPCTAGGLNGTTLAAGDRGEGTAV